MGWETQTPPPTPKTGAGGAGVGVRHFLLLPLKVCTYAVFFLNGRRITKIDGIRFFCVRICLLIFEAYWVK